MKNTLIETLLITGSRKIAPKLTRMAKEAVWRAKMNHWYVICGDAEGVDETVIVECDKHEVPITVFGAFGIVRHSTVTGRNVPLGVPYLTRDRRMAVLCTKCLSLHNTQSETHGTQYTYDQVKALGKECWLREDDGSGT